MIRMRLVYITCLCESPTGPPSIWSCASYAQMRIKVEGPRLWPEYSPDYYAVLFNDPDGIRLEVMNHLKRRKLVRKVWNELEGFANPLDRLTRRPAAR
jgi:hypothetical protein